MSRAWIGAALVYLCACAGAPSPEPQTPEASTPGDMRPRSRSGSDQAGGLEPPRSPAGFSDPDWQNAQVGGWYCLVVMTNHTGNNPKPMSTCWRSGDLCGLKLINLEQAGHKPEGCFRIPGPAYCFRKVNTRERYILPTCRRSMLECQEFRLNELENPRTSHEVFTECEAVE